MWKCWLVNLGEVGAVGSRGASRMWGTTLRGKWGGREEKALACSWKTSLNLELFGDKLATICNSWLCLTVTVGRCSLCHARTKHRTQVTS